MKFDHRLVYVFVCSRASIRQHVARDDGFWFQPERGADELWYALVAWRRRNGGAIWRSRIVHQTESKTRRICKAGAECGRFCIARELDANMFRVDCRNVGRANLQCIEC